jgi:hypothetical protein
MLFHPAPDRVNCDAVVDRRLAKELLSSEKVG